MRWITARIYISRIKHSLENAARWTSQNPVEFVLFLIGGVFIAGSVSTGIAALYSLFRIENPRVPELLANISAGLAMPALALGTIWYAIQMKKMAETEEELLEHQVKQREQEIDAFRERISEEIASHQSEMPDGTVSVEEGDYSLSTEVYDEIYDENPELMQSLSNTEKQLIDEYYDIIKRMEELKGVPISYDTYDPLYDRYFELSSLLYVGLQHPGFVSHEVRRKQQAVMEKIREE